MNTQNAIEFFGSKAKLARALDIKAPSIHNWGEQVPKQRQYELERITKGALKADWPVKAKK